MFRLLSFFMLSFLILSPVLADETLPKKLVFGFVPDETESALKKRYGGVIAYLEKQLNLTIELRFPTTFNGVIDGMKDKQIDLARFGPKSYVEATDKSGAVAFARILSNNGSEGYHSIIVTLKSSGLNTLDDLKGKRWLYTDPDSTSGTLIPKMYFYVEARIDPEKYFSSVGYSGSHQKSIIALQNKEVDAVAVSDDLLRRGKDNAWSINVDDFKIVWQSELIPNSLFAYRDDLPENVKQAVKEAVLNFHDEDVAYKGFVPAKDEDYNFIRKMYDYEKRLSARRR